MRILHTISSIAPSGGGPIEGIQQLAAVNKTYGHDVELVSLDEPGADYVKAFPIPIHAMGRGYLRYQYNSRYVPWLREHAKDYDVVIVNGIWQYHSFGAWRALRNHSTPYVVYTHGMLGPWFKRRYPLKHLKKLLYWPWAEYRVLRDAAAVLFTCEMERILARESFSRYKVNEVVVNYGTSGPQNIPNRGVDEFRARYTELQGKRLAIFMGRLHEIKGCDLLLQAFAKVLAPNPEWHLLVCGPDQAGGMAKMQTLAAKLGITERVTFTGMVRGELKWGALHAAEIFVLPSHHENFGIVVAEALACGVPTLISNQVNIYSEVEQDGAGLVADDTEEGTCEMLRKWTNMSAGEQQQMKANTTRCFRNRFEIHNASMNLLSVLSLVVDRERPAYDKL